MASHRHHPVFATMSPFALLNVARQIPKIVLSDEDYAP